jgi:hypothetical protein
MSGPRCDRCKATPELLYLRDGRLLCRGCRLAEVQPHSQPASLISCWPCDGCDSAATEIETGAGYCKASPSGDAECAAYRLVAEIEEIAGQVAVLIAGIGDEQLRREIAEGAADGFANALYEQGAGARLSDAAFYAACGVHRIKAAA